MVLSPCLGAGLACLGPYFTFRGARSWTTNFKCFLQLEEIRFAGKLENSVPATSNNAGIG